MSRDNTRSADTLIFTNNGCLTHSQRASSQDLTDPYPSCPHHRHVHPSAKLHSVITRLLSRQSIDNPGPDKAKGKNYNSSSLPHLSPSQKENCFAYYICL